MESVVIEIRPAEGGDDAKLFALELFKVLGMYSRRMGWSSELVDLKEAKRGAQEIVFLVRGKGVIDGLTFEAGGHRVQRVPPTEKRGRRQTSTVTVAVLPEPKESEVRIREQDLRWDTMKSHGHGGQSVNTTDSAVRVTHVPTGVSAISYEKSQHANRRQVLTVLRSRLLGQQREREARSRNRTRSQQVGSGMRGDKVRTIRYQDGRVTDHRTGRKMSLKDWTAGKLEMLR